MACKKRRCAQVKHKSRPKDKTAPEKAGKTPPTTQQKKYPAPPKGQHRHRGVSPGRSPVRDVIQRSDFRRRRKRERILVYIFISKYIYYVKNVVYRYMFFRPICQKCSLQVHLKHMTYLWKFKRKRE